MPRTPRIVERAAQPYVAVSGLVTMQTVGAVADRIPEVFGWLGARGIEPAGAPFLRYRLIDMERQLEVEAGVPVVATAAGDGEVVAGMLPAGRYAALTHVGSFDGLVAATAALLDWAAQQGLAWDVTDTPEGQRWGCRLEVYETDPAEQPDMSKWETQLLFRLAD
jgi:effector-binding domain-containing protein